METISSRKPELVEDLASSHFEQVFVRSQSVVSRRVARQEVSMAAMNLTAQGVLQSPSSR
jgi:hypothetical protein